MIIYICTYHLSLLRAIGYCWPAPDPQKIPKRPLPFVLLIAASTAISSSAGVPRDWRRLV